MKKIMKHKIGDIVQIKSRKWYNKNQNGDGRIWFEAYIFIPKMTKYLGKTATITKVMDGYYRLDIDKQLYGWTDDMFEDEIIPKEIKNSEPKKEIDWEQRRWELIKIFLLSTERRGVEFQTNEEELDAVIDLTDKFIKLLKK
jgi:hypothetical protein